MNPEMEKISKTLYVMKAFAILSVIMAHMTFSETYHIAEIIRVSLGQIGVVIFFISSGYFYSRKPDDSKEFWYKKAKFLLIPWFIFSTIVFILSNFVFSKPHNLLVGFIKNFFGIGTVYWYMTVLVIMLFLFRYINKDISLVLCIGVSIISIFLSALGIIDYSVDLNQYVNIFNWIGFFALGVLLRKKKLMDKLICPSAAIISLIGLIAVVVIAVVRGNKIEAYIDITSLFAELFGFVFLLNVSNLFANNKLLTDVGKKSFFIYLMHVQAVGIVNTRLPYNTVFFILRPFIGLAVCYIISVSFKFILNRLNLSKYNFVFGLDR